MFKKFISITIILAILLTSLGFDVKKNQKAEAVVPILGLMSQLAVDYAVGCLIAGGLHYVSTKDIKAIARNLGDTQLWLRDMDVPVRDKTITMQKYYDGKEPFPRGVKAFITVPSARANLIRSYITSLIIGTGMSFLVDYNDKYMYGNALPYYVGLYDTVSVSKNNYTYKIKSGDYYIYEILLDNYFDYNGEFLITKSLSNDYMFSKVMVSKDGVWDSQSYSFEMLRPKNWDNDKYIRLIDNNKWEYKSKLYHEEKYGDLWRKIAYWNYDENKYDYNIEQLATQKKDDTLNEDGTSEYDKLILTTKHIEDENSYLSIKRISIENCESDEYLVENYIPNIEYRLFADNPFIAEKDVIIPIPNYIEDWEYVEVDDIIKEVNSVNFGNVELYIENITDSGCKVVWNYEDCSAEIKKQTLYINDMKHSEIDVDLRSKEITNLNSGTKYVVELEITGEENENIDTIKKRMVIYTSDVTLGTEGGQSTEIDVDSIGLKEKIVEKTGINKLSKAIVKMNNIKSGEKECPKIKLNLYRVFEASMCKINPNTVNPFENKDYNYIDFCILEEFELFGMNMIEFLRFALGLSMIILTLMYVWKKIIPDKVID